jgi:hypothetical protein
VSWNSHTSPTISRARILDEEEGITNVTQHNFTKLAMLAVAIVFAPAKTGVPMCVHNLALRASLVYVDRRIMHLTFAISEQTGPLVFPGFLRPSSLFVSPMTRRC